MKRNAVVSLCLLFFLALIFSACEASSGKKSDDKNMKALIALMVAPKTIITACGDINANTTWTSNNLYVINCPVSVNNATLTIQPGTIIKIDKENNLPIQYPLSTTGDYGIIKAEGASSAHVAFTSYADDTIGGDTNKDGASTAAAKGDWGGLWISSGSRTARSTFTYCDFFYGGYNPQNYDFRAMLQPFSTPVTIDHCTFAHSAHAGLNLNSIDLDNVVNKDETTHITNCVFYDNGKPLFICPNFTMDGSNKFYNPGNTAQTNAYNGIWVMDSTQITSAQSWGNNGVPYVSVDGLFIDPGVTLTLGAGTILKFGAGAIFYIDDPSNIAGLTGAVYTSIKDDARGGDTNNDGATTPADGDWQGIQYGANWVSGSYIFYATHH